MRTTVLLSLAVALAACGSNELDPIGSGGSAGTDGGGGGGGGDVAAPCELALSWQSAPPLPAAVDHHGAFVLDTEAGAQLYVAGGNDYGAIHAPVYRAPIGDDGLPTAWSETAALPLGRAGMGVVTQGRRVLLLGGRTLQGGGLVDIGDTLASEALSDGTLAAWQAGPAMPGGRFHLSAARSGEHVYATGGLDTTNATDTVFRTRWHDDGTLEPWVEEAPMPRPRSHHVSFTFEGALYLVGGLDGNPNGAYEDLADVQRAAIGDDGALGAWEEVSVLDETLATHASFLRGRCFYVLGGIGASSTPSTAVRRAELDAAGALGTWETLATPLPSPRSHVHQAPYASGHTYVVGGSESHQNVVTDVLVGSLQ